MVDITDRVSIGHIDDMDNTLTINECVCGYRATRVSEILRINGNEHSPTQCTKCNRKLYFEWNIKVYQLDDGESEQQ